ncbi:MAG: RDD family protein [Methylotenera sp.]
MTQNATRLRLFAACIYEFLLLVALWMLCTWIFVRLFGEAATSYKLFYLRLFLWLVTGAYFVWCWGKTGQTLAAQTWKIKLVNQQNATLNIKQALIRYALSSASVLACGLGFIWALVDKDRLFLHDRLLKTRFIRVL